MFLITVSNKEQRRKDSFIQISVTRAPDPPTPHKARKKKEKKIMS